MYLKHLSLLNFRSYRHLELELTRGPVVIHGDNAQGKTNLLEAVYLLSIAKSFRADNDRQVVNWEAARAEGQALVGGIFQGRGETLQLRVGFQCLWQPGADRERPDGGEPPYQIRKRIRVNGIPRTAAQVVGLASSVLFTADDVQLVRGSPEVRRRFLDILISQVDRQYLRSLQRYQRVVYQRNQLLKLLRERRASEDEMAFWDEELVREGAFIVSRRVQTLEAIAILVRERHRTLTGGEEELEARYVPSMPLEAGGSAEEAMAKALEAKRGRERALGVTLTGPHRDDLRLLVGGVDMASYASRGQARTIGLALRLSEAAYLADLKGEEPILLLDDVLSELDTARRQQVMEAALAQEQAMVTTTDLAAVEGSLAEHASLFRAHGGTVAPSDVSLRRRSRG